MEIGISEETKARVNLLLSDVPDGAERAFTSAMGRALTRASTVASQEVRNTYAIKKKAIDEFTKTDIKKPTPSDVCGVVRFAGTQIPLYKYSLTRPKEPTPGMKVRAGQKTATTFENAFIAKMKSGHLGIFERSNRGNLPIKEIMGSSMASMVGNENIMEKVQEETSKMLDQRIEQEVHRLLNGYGGK